MEYFCAKIVLNESFRHFIFLGILGNMQTEFQKLVTKLHKKHRWQMQEIAEELGVGQSTISNCFYRRQGNTGAKFVPELQEIIEELEGKPLVFTPPAPKSKVSIRENESLKQDGL